MVKYISKTITEDCCLVGCEVVVDSITIHFGPCEEDGSNVWEWEVYRGQHPMSKRTWDTGVVKVIKGR